MTDSSSLQKVLDYFRKAEKDRVVPGSSAFEDEPSVPNDYDIDHHAICIVSGAHCASREELLGAIESINKIIGTGYYDDEEGDALLRHIETYLRSKL